MIIFVSIDMSNFTTQFNFTRVLFYLSNMLKLVKI